MMGRLGGMPTVAVAAAGLLIAMSAGRRAAAADKFEHLVEWAPRVYAWHGGGLEVRAARGRIKLLAGSDGRVRIRASLRSSGRDAAEARAASRASTIAARMSGERLVLEVIAQDPPQGSTAVELELEVPARCSVRVR